MRNDTLIIFDLHHVRSSAEAENMQSKAREALARKFVPILGAGSTTVLACIPAFFTRIRMLRIFAEVICIAVLSGIFFSFFFFIPLCAVAGPIADSNTSAL